MYVRTQSIINFASAFVAGTIVGNTQSVQYDSLYNAAFTQPGSKEVAVSKWNEALKYVYKKRDLERLIVGFGPIYTYHGAPEEYAEALVRSGPRVPYTVESVAKRVAVRYGLDWPEFYKYAFRAQSPEKIERLSTAPILVAMRWASSFKQGEVLTALNAWARMLVEAKRIGGKRDKVIDELFEKARSYAKPRTMTTDQAPDVLNLPDKFPRITTTGAIVQILTDVQSLSNSHAGDAQSTLDEMAAHPEEKEGILLRFNDSYVDMKIDPSAIKSTKIVVRGIPYGTTDVIQYDTIIELNTGKASLKRRVK